MYHDAAEDPNVLESEENLREAGLSHGGCGSSSLRECIELLNSSSHKSPATCHSGPKMENRSDPSQVMSPNVEESQTTADQIPSDLTPGDLLMPKSPQRSDRFRRRPQSPDPYMFSSTIWIRHDSEASARAHGDPVDSLRDRMLAMEHNLDTLRTRLTQVADLRDAQGIREDHRAIIVRLNEVEECATVHTLREFMSKICRLEAMFTGEDGGANLWSNSGM